jgi:hypothetical protein
MVNRNKLCRNYPMAALYKSYHKLLINIDESHPRLVVLLRITGVEGALTAMGREITGCKVPKRLHLRPKAMTLIKVD